MNRPQTALKGADFLREIFLTKEDGVKCHGSLLKLTPHLEGPVVVTGGIAVGWHLLNSGVQREKKHLNDIDIVVQGTSGLRASLTHDFLVRHFHPFRGKGKILIMLVDKEHRTRIDVFTPVTDSALERLTAAPNGVTPLRFISAEDLLVKLLSILLAVTEGKPVEPKYVAHFNSLSMVADRRAAGEIWREYRKEGRPLDFREAAEAVGRSIALNPALLQAGRYSRDLDQACPWCRESGLFPLAPLPEIYEILGYV